MLCEKFPASEILAELGTKNPPQKSWCSTPQRWQLLRIARAWVTSSRIFGAFAFQMKDLGYRNESPLRSPNSVRRLIFHFAIAGKAERIGHQQF
jgi:hypothetical protein